MQAKTNIQEKFPLNRRNFVKVIFGGAAAAALPSMSCRIEKIDDSETIMKEAALKLSANDTGDEKFWAAVKSNYALKKDKVVLNAANLCPAPIPVQNELFELTKDEDSDCSFNNRRKFGGMKENARSGIADMFNVSADNIALTRNTSEGNNTVINGIAPELKPGDEVVIWSENHPTNNIAWDVRAEKYGFKVIKISTPHLPSGKEELIEPFRNVLNSNTRVLAFSHVSNVSGVALPAKELCDLARSNGTYSHIDGAQTFGAKMVDLDYIGCDMYTGSGHKWFCGPKEVGILYVRNEMLDKMFPTNVGVGWQSAVNNGARKFDNLGQRDDAAVSAVAKAVEFRNIIGEERITKRITELAAVIKSVIKSRIPDANFHTPVNPELSGGVVKFDVPGIDMSTAMNTLYNNYNVGCAVTGSGEFKGIRYCPHIYNTLDDIEMAVEAVVNMV